MDFKKRNGFTAVFDFKNLIESQILVAVLTGPVMHVTKECKTRRYNPNQINPALYTVCFQKVCHRSNKGNDMIHGRDGA